MRKFAGKGGFFMVRPQYCSLSEYPFALASVACATLALTEINKDMSAGAPTLPAWGGLRREIPF